MEFHIVDVFASEKYGGNQLAVFIGCPEDRTMQALAREMNFSETTFITSTEPGADGAYSVRIFTPRCEVPFAGHPVLGTAYVLLREVIKDKRKSLTLKLKAGSIDVSAEYEASGDIARLVMRQLLPSFGAEVDKARLGDVLGLAKEDFSSEAPAQVVSTGLPFLIVPVRRLEAMQRIKLDLGGYYDLIGTLEAKALLVFCPETYDKQNHLNVRMFAPAFGIPEDPATGSGCGCLAAYLVKTRFFGAKMLDLRAEQGIEVQRPSLLYLRAEEAAAEEVAVHVGGKVFPVARGQWM